MASANSRLGDDPVRDEAFRRELVGLIPHLRAFARTLQTIVRNAVDELVEFGRARRFELCDEVIHPTDRVQGDDLGDRMQLLFRGPRQLALYLDQHVRADLAALQLRAQAHRESFDDPTLLQSLQARIDTGPGDAQGLGQARDRRAGILAQHRQQPAVPVIQ